MKIIYLHQYFVFPEEPGGTRSFDLATTFIKKGYEVEVVTSSAFIKGRNFNPKWNLIERDGIRIHVLNLDYSNSFSATKRSIVFLKFLWFSTLKLLSLNGDLLLASSTPLTIGIPALVKKWLHKTRFIFEVRDVWPEAVISIGVLKNPVLKSVLYFLEELIYKNASAIVALSDDMKHSIISRYPQFNQKPFRVIENIANVERFNCVFKKDVLKEHIGYLPRFTVLYAGTFGKVNGMGYVIKLARHLMVIDDSIVFILIGNGAEKPAIVKEAKDTGVLNKNVFILDSVPKQDLPELYRQASMGSSFVIDIPELWANSANKFFDTLAAGRPVLINYLGWQSEVIRQENIGYVLPQDIDLDAAIDFVNYSKDRTLILTQKANALKLAKTNYSLDVAAKKYVGLFEKLIFESK